MCFFSFRSLFPLLVSSFLFFSFLFPIDLSLMRVRVVIGTTCNIYLVRGSIFRVASGVVVFFRRE